MVGIPITAEPEVALAFVRGGTTPLFDLLAEASEGVPDIPNDSPLVNSTTETRSEGIARTSLRGGGRQALPTDQPEGLFDVEIWESGSIRMMIPRVVELVSHANHPLAVINDSIVIAWAHRLVLYAERLAHEVGYSGSWAFGVHVAGIRRLPSRMITSPGHSRVAVLWAAPEYERVIIAPGPALTEDRYAIVERLVGRFAAGLGVHDAWPGAFALLPGAED